ncbi:MAG: MarR family winged helix-turn-helix transcriptional regulator [Bacteroidetes bacterium]|nr:MarR family winged helix-turn-helix transcriptional regulator [Bacteroidota bacterium]
MNTEKKYGKKKSLALDTWVKLARAFTMVGRKSEESIRSFGLTTAQFGVIEALGHLGDMNVGRLCEKMLVTGGNMTLVLDNLEKQKLVERVANAKDRRTLNITLTSKGKNLFDEIFVKHAGHIETTFSVLNEDEQKQLGSLLKKLGLGIKK